MFRRKRAQSNPHVNANPSPSAALAATQAFLKNAGPNANLSSAAAAAALRSHTSSPTPVADIQTKRMARRASVTAPGSDVDHARLGLQRQSSSGSMTERTFRAASPGRGSPALPPDVPPVPAIPKSVAARQHRRAASMEPPPLRVASPPPRKPSGRGVSVDRGNQQPSRQLQAARIASMGKEAAADLERENNRNSINFSRPISPVNSPIKTTGGGWYTQPAVSEENPRAEPPSAPRTVAASTNAQPVARSIQDAADRPVRKKEQKASYGAEGSHLAAGTMSSAPTVRDASAAADIWEEQTRAAMAQAVPVSDGPSSKQRKIASLSPVDTSVSPTISPASPRSPVRSTSPLDRAPNVRPGLLAKQPSVVKEDREREEEAERADAQKIPVSEKQHLRAVSQPMETSTHPREATLAAPTRTGTGRGERPKSLSPARAAHFAPAPIVGDPNGVRHQPPPRAFSPAKSALKHSPSSSVRGNSPIATFHSNQKAPPSENSDTISIISDDGYRGGKKKKNVRVSFDEDAVAVSRSPESVVGAQQPPDAVEDFEMKPRPALPSFGSVRGRSRQMDDQEMPEKVTETVSSSMATSVSTLPDRLEPSSDHAVGGILAHDYANKNRSIPDSKQQQAVPLPPEVTSVEGTGYNSDTEGSAYSQDDIEKHGKSAVRLPDETPVLSKDDEKEHSRPDGFVPAIAILPATPAIDDNTERRLSPLPGDFPDEPAATQQLAEKPPTNATVPQRNTVSSATMSHWRPVTPEEESSDDDDSVYSDAAEEMVLGEPQFASLNAIVESPVIPAAGIAVTTPPDSPHVDLNTKAASPLSPLGIDTADPEPEGKGDWKDAQAYWSGLSEQRKKEIERKARRFDSSESEESSDEDEKAFEATPPAPVVTPRKTAKPSSTPVTVPSKLPAQRTPTAKQEQAVQPKPAMRKTMRQASPEPEPVSMRTSMRQTAPEPQGHHMRMSMRDGGLRSSLRGSAESAPVNSSPQQYREPRGALQKKHIRPQSAHIPASESYNLPSSAAAAASAPKPAAAKQRPVSMASVGRTFSNDSDSESSFKRQRRRKPASGAPADRISMRRTMRGGTDPRPASPTANSDVFSVRSMPTSMRGSMLTSLRGSAEPKAPTLRSQEPPKSKGILGFGKSSRVSSPPPSKPASKLKSRFADSSDEEGDARPSAFRSRFADSDDEDVPLPSDLRPVRGIPKRRGADDGDSTDLSDSEEERSPLPSSKDIEKGALSPAAVAPVTPKKVALPAEGSALAAKTMRPNETNGINGVNGVSTTVSAETPPKKKRGFFSFGRKKKETAPSPMASEAKRPSTPPLGPPHPAVVPSADTTPRSPRLQRRNTPILERMLSGSAAPSAAGTPGPNPALEASDSWPLPLPPKINADDTRPHTADGVPLSGPVRPPMGNRTATDGAMTVMTTATARTVDEKGRPVAFGRSGKKKKFMGLRRMFKLDD